MVKDEGCNGGAIGSVVWEFVCRQPAFDGREWAEFTT